MASAVTAAALSLKAGVMPLTWNSRHPSKACFQGTAPGSMREMAEMARSYSTLLGRGEAPYSTKYSPSRSSLVHTTKEVSTPISRALLRTMRPSGFSGRRLIQAALNPRRETPAATLSSEPPTVMFNCVACSSRWKSGGERRSMHSPNVTTSGIQVLLCWEVAGQPRGSHPQGSLNPLAGALAAG